MLLPRAKPSFFPFAMIARLVAEAPLSLLHGVIAEPLSTRITSSAGHV